MSHILYQRKPKIKATMKYLVVLIVVLLVATFQDYLHSRYNDYSFYASESLLFNMFWVLILPVALILTGLFTQVSALDKIRVLTVKRILFVALAAILHILLFAILIHVISALFYEHTFTFERNLRYTVSEDLYKYLLIYSVIALILIRNKIPTGKPNSRYLDRVIVGSARTKIAIKTSDICYISAEAPYVAIHSSSKKHLHTTTLRAIMDQLDPDRFVRIHKSTIVNLAKVTSYTSRLNGDYNIQLSDRKELRLSRNYVDNFKHRFSAMSSS